MKSEEKLLNEATTQHEEGKKYVKSDTVISFKLNNLLRDKFKEACNAQGTDMKSEIIRYIENYVNDFEERKIEKMEKIKKEIEKTVSEFIEKSNENSRRFIETKIFQSNTTPVGISNFFNVMCETLILSNVDVPDFLLLREEALEKEYQTSQAAVDILLKMQLANALTKSKKK